MRRFIAASIVATGLIGAVAAPSGAAPKPTSADIVETAISLNSSGPYQGQFDTLIEAVTDPRFDGALLAALSDPDVQLTVFAPTDGAFADLLAALDVADVNDLPADLLKTVLLYHVSPGYRAEKTILVKKSVPTLSGTKAPIANGEIDGAGFVATDVRTSNGVIHAIDAVMLPTDN